jgi:hypothetical protein
MSFIMHARATLVICKYFWFLELFDEVMVSNRALRG